MRGKTIAMALVLLVALAVRVWDLPSPSTLRDGDELGYLSGGLLLWEGITPGFKMAPAGPLTWVTWSYAAAESVKSLVQLHKEKPALPAVIRPYAAIEKALFNIYQDLTPLRAVVLAVITLLALVGTWAAFQIGLHRAGIPGGVLCGGLFAIMPLSIMLCGVAKPYAMAWSFTLIAYYFAAAHNGRRARVSSAIFLGLAISSRIEMVAFLPIILSECWYRNSTRMSMRQLLWVVAAMVATVLLVSPWLLTNLLGNLRTIATVRLLGPSYGENGLSLLRSLVFGQGLGPSLALLVAGLIFTPASTRLKAGILAFYIGLLFLGLWKPTGFGLRHHGPVLLAILVATPLALHNVKRRWSRSAWPAAALILIFPVYQSVHAIVTAKHIEVTDHATAWIEKNIPPGTIVYLNPTFHDPLPTREAADALWSQVVEETAWQTKFRYAAGRFEARQDALPRALSEENMIQERGNRRRWFILGAQEPKLAPRFMIRIYSGGSPFDIPDGKVIGEFERTGGVLIWRGAPLKLLGKPGVSWTNSDGTGTFVYVANLPNTVTYQEKAYARTTQE